LIHINLTDQFDPYVEIKHTNQLTQGNQQHQLVCLVCLQRPQQPPPTGNTFTSTQAAPHSTTKTNRAESEAQMPQTSKNNLKKEEEDAGVILELPKNAGCT